MSCTGSPNLAALQAFAALDGTHAVDLSTDARYVRLRGTWQPLDPALGQSVNGDQFDCGAQTWVAGHGQFAQLTVDLSFGTWLVGLSSYVTPGSPGWGSYTVRPVLFPAGDWVGIAMVDPVVYEHANLTAFTTTGLWVVNATNTAGTTGIGFQCNTFTGTPVHVNSSLGTTVRIGTPLVGTSATTQPADEA